MKIIIAFFSMITGLQAFAGSMDCSSYDAKLTYHRSQPDGGAYMGPSVLLELNNQTLLSISPRGGTQINLANFALSNQPIWQGTPVLEGYYEKSRSLSNISVVTRADGVKVFDDLVYCQTSVYKGPPIP